MMKIELEIVENEFKYKYVIGKEHHAGQIPVCIKSFLAISKVLEIISNVRDFDIDKRMDEIRIKAMAEEKSDGK